MTGLIITIVVIAVSVAVTWCICSTNSNTSNGNQTDATSVNRRPAQERTDTGPMVYFANDRHGRSDREYRFNYKKVNGSWRAYILRMPNLCGRDAGGMATHRLFDNGQPYVCWDSRVSTLKEMQTISRVWADSIQEYIATGKRFGPQ